MPSNGQDGKMNPTKRCTMLTQKITRLGAQQTARNNTTQLKKGARGNPRNGKKKPPCKTKWLGCLLHHGVALGVFYHFENLYFLTAVAVDVHKVLVLPVGALELVGKILLLPNLHKALGGVFHLEVGRY